MAASEFIRAVAAADFDTADHLLPTLRGEPDAALCRALADLHSHRHRWADAADALAALDTPEATLRLNLCRNLAALKSHRPDVYRVAMGALEGEAGPYRPHPLVGGAFTIAKIDGPRAVPFNADPAAQSAAAMKQLTPINVRGEALALLSISDGHVLSTLAANPPTLFLGRQQPIYVFEPDATLLLANLLIHDWSGELGPIRQERVLWYVGPKWAEAFRLDVLTDRCLIFPKINIKQGGASAAIESSLLAVLNELGQIDTAAGEEIARYYANRTPADHAKALAGEAGRPARVLLLTTLFSTVLQHSTRDADDAFRRLGCQTMVLIEPTPHHGVSRSTMRQALAEFKPDLVFQIDHHRFEHGDIFPAGLPFVNWIQDLLPHLMTPAAGRQHSATDFSLTPSLQRWVDDFAYPERQCLEFRKLTRVPPRPPARQSDGNRVVYVSNWSQTRQQIIDELLHGSTETTRAVINEACRRMMAVYDDDGSLPSFGDVRTLLDQVMSDLGVTADADFVKHTVTRLSDRLNNLLYRHQGLAWAAAACEKHGLKLEIYGRGWDRHPQFAPFARGNVGYGQDLEELTRSAGVNLILEPFMCMAHQRLLDALAAGGFCLVRDHPANHTCTQWIEWLANQDDAIDTAAALRNAMPAELKDRVEALVARCAALDGSAKPIDQVTAVRRLQRAGFFPRSGAVLPALETVTFDSAHALGQRLARVSRDDVLRTEISAIQRKCVEERYSYQSGMKRVLAFVCERLNEQQTARLAA